MPIDAAKSPLGDLDMGAHFVLFAAPRSGTTWLKAMLNLHPEVHCTEMRLFGRAEMLSYDRPQAPERPNIRLTLDEYAAKAARVMTPVQPDMTRDHMQTLLQRVMIRAMAGMVRRQVKEPVIVDKITPYQGREKATYEAYRRWFPNATFVFLLRDGRDVVTSGMYHWYKRRMQIEPTSFESLRAEIIEGRGTDGNLTTAFRPGELAAWAQNWAEVARLQAGHPGLTVFYEAMLDQPAAVLEKLFATLGVSTQVSVVESCIRGATFEVMSGGRKRGETLPEAHVRRGMYGDWLHCLTRQDGTEFAQLAGQELIRLGYEADSRWIEQLRAHFALS